MGKPILVAFIIITIMAIVKIATAQITNIDTDIGTISKDANRILISKDLNVLFDIQRPNNEFIAVGNISKTREWGYTTAAWDYVKGDVRLIDKEYVCLTDTIKDVPIVTAKDMQLTVKSGMCIKYPQNYTILGTRESQQFIPQVNYTIQKEGINVTYPSYYDPEFVNFTGSPGAICNINTPYYNVTLSEGCIENYFSYLNWSMNWGYNGTTTSNNAIGSVSNAAGSFVFSPTTTNDCVNSSTIDTIKLDCYNLAAPTMTYLNWTFNKSYIQHDTVANSTYRPYYYIRINITQPINITFGNGTTLLRQAVSGTYNDWDSKLGIVTFNKTATAQMIVYTWNESITTDVDKTNGAGGTVANSYAVYAIARSSEIAANVRLRQYMKILTQNTSQTGAEITQQPARAFKSDLLYQDPVSSPPASTCTWEPGADWMMTDYCNITAPVDICPYRLIVNGTGRLNLTNGAIINATLFQFYPATAGWRVSVKQGGFKRC
jgi:hypothetical protein